MQRVFVKVVGFSDVERHALNTLFRLSEERGAGYAPWTPEAGVPAQLALIDSESMEALVEFESPSNAGLRMVWIGDRAPARAWRSFPRPIDWPAVIAALDPLLRTPDLPPVLDFDLDGYAATAPAPARRALIASGSRDERLYLRARMALADLTQADEAETVADAMELARRHRYDVAVVDHALPGKGLAQLVRHLVRAEPRVACVIVTQPRLSAAQKARALLGRRPIVLEKPVDPLKLTALLRPA